MMPAENDRGSASQPPELPSRTTPDSASPEATPAAGAAPAFRASNAWIRVNRSPSLQLLFAALVTIVALAGGWSWLVMATASVLLVIALAQLLPPLWRHLGSRLDDAPTARVLALGGLILAGIALTFALGWWEPYLELYRTRNWEAIGAIGEGVIGAFGQILVALVALAIAWRQVMVDQRLTGQQNRITQAQTIDSFIHGISELISDEEGLLEDWPLERMLAEGRLAAVISSIDREGKARILRFLSHARLLTPLRRDHRLGRAILDGQGSYEEDRLAGVPVIRLQRMLKGVDLAATDLRGVDFNAADLRGTDFSHADLSEANLSGCDLRGANLEGARLEGTRFFYGRAQTATPRGVSEPVDHVTGHGSGTIVENVNFSGTTRLDPQSHHYLASWSGPRSRQTIPGGCRGVPNHLSGHVPESP